MTVSKINYPCLTVTFRILSRLWHKSDGESAKAAASGLPGFAIYLLPSLIMRSTTLLIVLQALPVALSASSLHGKQRCIEHNVLATNTTQFIPQHLVFFGDAALHKPLNPAAKKIKKQGHKEQEVLHVKPAESVSTTSPPRRKPKPEIWAEQDDVGQLGLGAYVGVPVETSQVTAEVPVLTTTLRLGVAQIPFRPSTLRPQTKGYILTALPTWGNPTTAPILSTLIPTPTTTLAPAAAKAASPKSSSIMSAPSSNIFQPIDTSAPPQSIGRRSDHPAPRTGIQQQTTPIGTNKFYANFFLGGQAAASWTHPYSVAWAKGSGASGSWGLAISHIDSNQRVFGPNKAWGAAEFFYSPVGLQSIVLSATSLGSTTRLVTNGLTAFAANVNLLPREGAAPAITFPLVQGMGFVTAIYKATTPAIQTGMFIRSMTAANSPRTGIVKYKLLLEDGKTWLLYAWSPSGARLTLNLVNNGLVQATSNFDGFIQVAKSTNATSEATYDRTCGNFATGVNLSGSVNGNVGTYAFNFSKAGRLDAPLVMFALPHHIASLHDTTRLAMVNVELDTTTKGKAQAIVADSWIMQEGLPVNMDFRPGLFPLSDTAKNTIASLAQSEVSQDMNAQTNLNSMYFAGKVGFMSGSKASVNTIPGFGQVCRHRLHDS